MGNCVGKDSKASNAKGNQPGRAAAAAANLKRFDDLLEQVTDPTLERVVRPKQRYEVRLTRLVILLRTTRRGSMLDDSNNDLNPSCQKKIEEVVCRLPLPATRLL